MPDMNAIFKEAVIQIGSGGSAGFVEVCIMHPLDLVKTRLQIQVATDKSDPNYYSGIGDCFRKMYKNEGVFSFWKGILPPILAETPKRAVKFFTFEQYKQFFMFGSPKPTPLTFSLAGLGAGLTEGVLANPFEVLKITLQSNRSRGTAVPGTWMVTKQVLEKEGFFGGFYKGISATLMRNGIFNMFYFGFYHSVQGLLPKAEDPVQEFLKKVCIGFTSGTVASCLNIPFDVVKSRIQGPQPVPGQIKYKSFMGTASTLMKEEGFGSFYRGLLPKILRLGPGGAIMLVVYDYVHAILVVKFA